MLLDELEITEETKETLFDTIEDNKDKVKWLVVESFNSGKNLHNGVLNVRELLQPLEEIDYINGVKIVLILSYPSDETESKIKVKLYSEEPSINKNICIEEGEE